MVNLLVNNNRSVLNNVRYVVGKGKENLCKILKKNTVLKHYNNAGWGQEVKHALQ
jgi:hypothetical protein